MQLSTIVDRLDDQLRTEAYGAVDASPNGLQLGDESGEVTTVAFAVDAAVDTIERAGEADADLLVCHHGIIWGDLERVTGLVYDRVRALVEHDIGLYVSHLPLDGHQEFGNAAGIADVLSVTNREPFGLMDDEPIGVHGRLPDPVSVGAIESSLSATLDHGDGSVQVLDFGPQVIETIAIVTGSGTDWVPAAADAGIDAFITGEGKQQVYHTAKELGISVVLAGHYATETFGVLSLKELIDEWGLTTEFISAPTGL